MPVDSRLAALSAECAQRRSLNSSSGSRLISPRAVMSSAVVSPSPELRPPSSSSSAIHTSGSDSKLTHKQSGPVEKPSHEPRTSNVARRASAAARRKLMPSFASHVGKVGEAERKRKQASQAITQANPLRKAPIAKPLDYEKFVAEKGAQLENDSHRDLLLFPRDDIAETEVFLEERTVVPSVSQAHLAAAEWLFTKEALQLYSAPFNVTVFNYVDFAGDFKKIDVPGLGNLKFESDILADEKAAQYMNKKSEEVIKEGFVTVLHPTDFFRGERQRYVVVRWDENRGVYVFVQKSQTGGGVLSTYEVRKIIGASFKKTRQALHFYPTAEPGPSDKPSLIVVPENEADVGNWTLAIDRALSLNAKDDSHSIGDAADAVTMSARSAPDAESIASDGSGSSLRDANGAHIWRGKNAVGKALQPPLIERRNLFSLYSDMEPLPMPKGLSSALLMKTPTTTIQRNVIGKASKDCLALKAPSTDSRSEIEVNAYKIQITLEQLHCTLSFGVGESEQVEPFFVRMFLFDAGTGTRLTEEHRTSFIPSSVENDYLNGTRPRVTPLASPSSPGFGPSKINGISRSVLLRPRRKQFVCALAKSLDDVFLVVRVERVLSELTADYYGKNVVDPKHAPKIKKLVKLACTKLARYRTPFAWTACPLDLKPGFAATANGNLQLYRCDRAGDKWTDLDVCKLLVEYIKTDKVNKLTPIVNATIDVAIQRLSSVSNIPYRISSTLLPLKPWPVLSPSAPSGATDCESTQNIVPTFELQTFGDVAMVPYNELINLLYVYPCSLNYGSQKSFGRARNISCSVRFVSSIRREGSNAKAVIELSNNYGPFLQQANTAVLYHDQNPQFNDEIKIHLPVVLDATDHLLFSFTHVSVSNAKEGSKNTKEAVESPVGFAFFPLLDSDGHLALKADVSEFELPVAISLPADYIQWPKSREIKWIDSKPLFRFQLRLLSSVFTTESKLQELFTNCHQLQRIQGTVANGVVANQATTPSNRSCSPDAVEKTDDLSRHSNGHAPTNRGADIYDTVVRNAEKLAYIYIGRLVPYMHVILRRLFALLPSYKSDLSASKLLAVIVNIADQAAENGFNSILRNFVRFYYSIPDDVEDDSMHEAICKVLSKFIGYVAENDTQLAAIFRQTWFILDVVIKSMSQWLMRSKKFKSARRDRFSSDFYITFANLIDSLSTQIIRKAHLPEAGAANLALAYFLRTSLNLADRHIVLTHIHDVVSKYDKYAAEDTSVSRQNHAVRCFKLDLLLVLCGHEHWIPLALPLLTDRHNSILRGGPSGYVEPQTATSFISRFFSLFSATQNSGGPPTTLDHDSDRLDGYSDHFWLSEAYCQTHFLAGLLIQEMMAALREPRDYRPLVIALVRNLLAKHSLDVRYTDQVAQGRIALLYMPLIQFAINNIRELDATAKNIFETPEVPGMISAGMTWAALVIYDTPKSRQLTAPRRAIAAADATHGVLAEKLSKFEVKDILISVLYILAKVPKRTLSNVWVIQEQNGNAAGLVDFLHLIELILQLFNYPGRAYLGKQLTKKRHMLARATVNFQMNSNDAPKTRPSSSYGDLGSTGPRGTIDSIASSTTATTDPPSSVTLGGDADDLEPSLVGVSGHVSAAFLKEVNLTQEVGITVLDIAQAVSSELAIRCNTVTSETTDAAFHRLLLLYVRLLDESWPESVRLNSLAALSIFISTFAARFFFTGPMDPLAVIIEAMLLQLNSRFPKIQQASAALLQAILRKGYEVHIDQKAKEAGMGLGLGIGVVKQPRMSAGSKSSTPAPANKGIELLGRPGAQTSVALARLLGQRIPLTTSPYFDSGLRALEALIRSQGAEKKLSPFESAVIDLVEQLRGVLCATGALTEAEDNPIRYADLHIQLADSYRGSAHLRRTWFDNLAAAHAAEKWYSEAAVCQAHSIAIIARELGAKGVIRPDWSAFDMINDRIAQEENVDSPEMDTTQEAGFTIDVLTSKVEQTVQLLIQAERYEAVGPLCRLIIPVFERMNDFQSLMSIYVELQQASSRAAEIKASGKRHLGTYFRVIFHSPTYFGSDDKIEWIYREPGLTSLAEACDRMGLAAQAAVGHERIQVLPENRIDPQAFGETTAYIQMTHVEPCLRLPDVLLMDMSVATVTDEPATSTTPALDQMNYFVHTNIRHFYYDEKLVDDEATETTPEIAKLALRRVYLTVEDSFPNTRRRQRVVVRNEVILNPLELACDCIRQKAQQIRRFLTAAGIPPRCNAVGIDQEVISKLDIKGLQCFLQGAVSPSVNAGVLAYAEAFTTTSQKERYGKEGLEKLVLAFKMLMTELQDALDVNGRAIADDQREYQEMMQKSFSGMLERLKTFFGDHDFINRSTSLDDSYDAAYVLNSIGGVDV